MKNFGQKQVIQLTTIFILLGLVVAAQAAKQGEKQGDVQEIPMVVTNKGFEPKQLDVKPGTHVVLKVKRTTNATCATQIKIGALKLLKDLPLNQEVSVDLGVLNKGDIRFSCGMDMITGQINVK